MLNLIILYSKNCHVLGEIDYFNLIYPLAKATMKLMLQKEENEIRKLFLELFDENTKLQDRIDSFRIKINKLYEKCGGENSDHHDERTISTYLTYYNPDKYTFYKNEFYTNYCNYLGIKKKKAGKKFTHYLRLIDELISKYISVDDELIKMVEENIPQYDGTNHLILAQDILYQMLDKKEGINYWIFQGNPKIYNIEDALKNDAIKTWSVKSHKKEIKPGDKFILWVSGESSGCYALGEVDSEVFVGFDDENELKYYFQNQDNKESDRVNITITHNLFDSPILKAEMENIEELKKLKVGNQGTNFKATEEQYATIEAMIRESNEDFKTKLTKFDTTEVDIYFTFLKEIIKYFGLKKGDERLVFTINSGRLNFTVGHRYSWNLSKNDSRGNFGVISMTKLSENSELYKGKEPLPYYCYLNSGIIDSHYKDSIFKAIENELNGISHSAFRKSNQADFEDYVFGTKSSVKPVNMTLNQILYGPPGTGKTYNTINKALEIIDPEFLNSNINDRIKLVSRFNELKIAGQIVFKTFHQSMSYEDFVEGIKPIEPEKEGDNISYRIELGIFRNLCIEALFAIAQLRESKVTEEVLDFSILYDKFVENIEERLLIGEEVNLDTKAGGSVVVEGISQQGNVIIKHHSGTRTYTVSKARLTKLQASIKKLQEVNNINDQFREIIGGSNSSAYWSVLNAIRKEKPIKQTSTFNRTYKFDEKKEVVSSLVNSDYKNKSGKPYVLIIDEINRGNIAQIFGELITLIEKDKRLGSNEAIEVTLPYSKEKFGVPNNLYIIGTMNTADRSIEALDTALRRRFSFLSIFPNSELIKTVGKSSGRIDNIDLVRMLDIINERVEKLIDKDHTIGHSYFLKVESKLDLIKVFKDKVIPLLEEYFYGDYGKIGLILGDSFVEKVIDDNFFFADFADYDSQISQDLKQRPIFKIKPSEDWDFIKIYEPEIEK